MWTDLLVNKYAGRLWAFPHQVEANQDGINLTFPTRWNDEGRDPISEFPISLQGENFHPQDARAKEWGDWTLTFRMAESGAKYCDVTLGRGMPAVWLEYSGVTPIIKSDNDAKYFDEAGSALSLPTASRVLGLEYDNRFFGIYAHDGTRFSQNGDKVKVEFSGAKNDPVAHDNDTPGLFYYTKHSDRMLGEIVWEY